jgi:hypothetical protein
VRMELTVKTDDRGLTKINLKVPRGCRAEGLDHLDRILPALRELEQRSRATTMPGPTDQGRDRE